MESPFSGGKRYGGWEMGSHFSWIKVVMRHQEELGLTPDQQAALRSEAAKFAGQAMDLRWQESALRDALKGLLKQHKLDEQAILAAQEKLLKVEDGIRISRLTFFIHVKNTLTPEQQAKLTEIIKTWTRHHAWRGRGMWHHEMGFRPAVHRLDVNPGGPMER
jgi:Spy/CpxP family protein refolding chaperone